MTETLKPLDDAQRRRVESSLGRVEALARVMAKQVSHVSFEELRSAGYEGLVEAAQRYDPSLGVPFTGFAHPRIRGAMIDLARRAAPAVRRRSRALKMLEATQAVLERAQKGQELRGGQDTRTLQERVRAAADLVGRTTAAVVASKAAPTDPDTVSVGEASVEDAVVNAQLRERIAAIVQTLSAEDKALVDAVFEQGLSMAEYGAKLGKSRSTICRQKAKILAQIAKRMRDPPRRP